MSASRSDLQADLLADLQGAAAARTLPSDPPPVPAVTVAHPVTPVLAARLTPLCWSLPGLRADGLGLQLRIGPLELSVALG